MSAIDQIEFDTPVPKRKIRVSVSELMGDEREILLEHMGQDYRLRITSTGKLILTK